MKLNLHLFPAMLLAMAMSLISSPLFAQQFGTVSASGDKVIERLPTELVMRIDMVGRAETLDEALKTLSKRKESAELLLKSLGAKMDTIEYGDPTTSNAASQGQRQMQEMIRQRMGRIGGPVPEGLKIPESKTVTLPLTVRWSLDATDATQLLKLVTDLSKKIEDADLAGIKSEEANLAEQELIEESEAMGYDPWSDEEQTKPGTPVFSYAARITPEERSQAMKEAFAKAKANAQDLANAADQELGPLLNLHGSSDGGPSPEMMYDYSYRRGMPRMENNDPLSSESPQLGKVTFRFSVQASFRLADEKSN
ncbi:DUF541 domain-containing protein [bacterium]|nr:DUF541 domain-containing protein [bacterium]